VIVLAFLAGFTFAIVAMVGLAWAWAKDAS